MLKRLNCKTILDMSYVINSPTDIVKVLILLCIETNCKRMLLHINTVTLTLTCKCDGDGIDPITLQTLAKSEIIELIRNVCESVVITSKHIRHKHTFSTNGNTNQHFTTNGTEIQITNIFNNRSIKRNQYISHSNSNTSRSHVELIECVLEFALNYYSVGFKLCIDDDRIAVNVPKSRISDRIKCVYPTTNPIHYRHTTDTFDLNVFLFDDTDSVTGTVGIHLFFYNHSKHNFYIHHVNFIIYFCSVSVGLEDAVEIVRIYCDTLPVMKNRLKDKEVNKGNEKSVKVRFHRKVSLVDRLNTLLSTSDYNNSNGNYAKNTPHDLHYSFNFTLVPLHPSLFHSPRVIGQSDYKFILIQVGVCVFALDQHATDERIKLEYYTREWNLNYIHSHHHATFRLHIAAMTLQDLDVALLSTLNFSVETSDTGVLLTMPKFYAKLFRNKPSSGVCQLLRMKNRTPANPLVMEYLKMLACKSAIKFGDRLSLGECEELVSGLQKCKNPFQCAHGRPLVVPLFRDELVKVNGVRIGGKDRVLYG